MAFYPFLPRYSIEQKYLNNSIKALCINDHRNSFEEEVVGKKDALTH
jgi:hypothetical protein